MRRDKSDGRRLLRISYPDLDAGREKAEEELEEVKIEDEVTDVICEECGETWLSNTVRMENSWHVRDSRSAGIQSRIWKRLV